MQEHLAKSMAALSEAMALEQEGIDFYTKVADTVQDQEVRQTLLQLARDEKNHLSVLKRQHDSLSRQGLWQDSPEAPNAVTVSRKPFFPELEKAANMTDVAGSSVAEVLLFGMNIEARSYDFYNRTASTTDEPAGKALYAFLVAEETRHFNLLMARYEQVAGPTGWQY